MTKIVLFSGGDGAKSLVPYLNKKFDKITHAIANTDNGGSSGIIRSHFNNEAIIAVGDYRNRILTLCPTPEIKAFLSLRLPSDLPTAAHIWKNIDQHKLFMNLPQKKQDLIRENIQYINQAFENQPIPFNFQEASVGNLILTGLLFKSNQDSNQAINAFAELADLPSDTVLPTSLDSNCDLVATLQDGTVILGQDMISHPSDHASVNKSNNSRLPSPIHQIITVKNLNESLKNHAMIPFTQQANSRVIRAIRNADAVVFSRGSLTSIIPAISPKGIGEAIIQHQGKKILLVNGSQDRETTGLTLKSYIEKIVHNLDPEIKSDPNRIKSVLTHLIIPKDSFFDISHDIDYFQTLGITVIRADSMSRGHGKAYFQDKKLSSLLKTLIEPT